MIRLLIASLLGLLLISCGVEVEKRKSINEFRSTKTDLICYKGNWANHYGVGTVAFNKNDIDLNYNIQVVKLNDCSDFGCNPYDGVKDKITVSLYLKHNEFDIYINSKFYQTYYDVEQITCE